MVKTNTTLYTPIKFKKNNNKVPRQNKIKSTYLKSKDTIFHLQQDLKHKLTHLIQSNKFSFATSPKAYVHSFNTQIVKASTVVHAYG